MKYKAIPVIVDAFKIIDTCPEVTRAGFRCALDTGENVTATNVP